MDSMNSHESMTTTTNSITITEEGIERAIHPFFELPPLYFLEKQCTSNDDDDTSLLLLPELLQLCCTQYGNYGTLAKLSCVQSSWQNVLSDAVATQPAHQWALATSFHQGTEGLAPHPARAVRLWEQLTQITVQSHAPVLPTPESEYTPPEYAAAAMKQLADYYLQGEGASSELGLQWLSCAYEYGRDLDAAYELAMIYEYGHYGVALDIVQAFSYFERAAAAGHVEAMVELALCYELGCGVPVDDAQSLDWYLRAARAGHLVAHYSVGEAYEVARGVPLSPEEACRWYFTAAIKGDDDSLQALRRLRDVARIVIPGLATALPLLLNDTSG